MKDESKDTYNMSHINEKIDFTVGVYVVYRDKVLIRKLDKYKIWLHVGGHIERDEDPNQAAIREVKEEVGLDVTLFDDREIDAKNTPDYKELIPPKFLNIHKINDTHKHVDLIYFAKTSSDNIVEPEDEKSEECKWFTLKELDDHKYEMKEEICSYAKRALKELDK